MATRQILTIQDAISKSGIPVKSAGPVVVKRAIQGTSRPSQHSFGNAMDYYPSSSDEAARAARNERVPSLEALYSFLQQNKGNLPVRVICYYRRGGCTTAHLDHLHVDGDPHVSSDPGATGGEDRDVSPPTDYAAMSPSDLKSLPCAQYKRDADLILSLKSSFTQAQLDALVLRANACGQNNPLLPDFVEGPIESTGDALLKVGEFLGVLTTGELWVRVGFIAGGFALGAAGVYFIAKEFGAPSVTSVASAASGGVAGAVTKAIK